MVILRADEMARALAVNQAQRLPGVRWLKRALRRDRGGSLWWSRPDDLILKHITESFHALRAHVGDVAGKVAMEIGPGDNVAVAYCFLRMGCSRVIAVEKIASIIVDERAARVLRGVDELLPGGAPTFDQIARREGDHYRLDPARLEIRRAAFESLPREEEIDLIYSNDVMEHVGDPASVFRAAHGLLKPGGRFVNAIDLGPHNAFARKRRERPLDFLTCDDWLWDLMFSNIVTTNRVRYSEFIAAAVGAGFQVKGVNVTSKVDAAYLAQVRPHLLPRYRALPDEDLSILECMLVAEK